MTTLLVRHAHILVTMDAQRRELPDGGLFARDGFIEQVGPTAELPSTADEILDLRGHVVLPGLVNTHHHLYQTLTRCIAQDNGLFNWLKTLYPIWLGLTADAIHTSALTGMAELMLSGCTTASDHLYIYPNDCTIDDEIRAGQEIGLRFHATRGSMSLGESKGGLPPDKATEGETFILRDTRRAIEQHHDAQRYAMTRVGVAPCSPFSVTTDLMRESAALARSYGVHLHTHLAETRDEDEFCVSKFGLRPLAYAESVNWLGDDVWYAHGVHFNKEDIKQMGKCGCGVAHCPSSNMRLASGIAPIRLMLSAGVRVGLGVDGSASNDGNHMLGEARQAMLLQRVMDDTFAMYDNVAQAGNRSAISAYEALWVATRGGASVLGRDDIGQIAVGYAADLIAVNLNRVEYAGALHDPLAAVLFCAPRGVDFSMINGKVVIEGAQLKTIDLAATITRHNAISQKMINRE